MLVTGGFHSFADPVAEMLGFERVVGNVLGMADGALTGELAAAIVDSSVKQRTLDQEMERLGQRPDGGPRSLAMGDGANDIPMIEASDYGIAYYAKPKAKAAADGWIERGDLTSVLKLFDVPEDSWVK